MFFSDWRMLLRRWYAVVVGVVLTAGLCFGVTTVVQPSYEIKAMMLVLPPKSSVGMGGNPFLGLGGLQSVADVASRAMMDGNTVKSLVSMGANNKYLVAQDATSAGPVILVTSDGGSPAEAIKTLTIVKQQIPIKLLKLQEATQVPERSLITVNMLSQDETPAVVRKSQIRAVFGVFALGAALTLLLTGLLDGALLRRSRRLRAEQRGRMGEYPEQTAPTADPAPAPSLTFISPAAPWQQRYQQPLPPDDPRRTTAQPAGQQSPVPGFSQPYPSAQNEAPTTPDTWPQPSPQPQSLTPSAQGAAPRPFRSAQPLPPMLGRNDRRPNGAAASQHSEAPPTGPIPTTQAMGSYRSPPNGWPAINDLAHPGVANGQDERTPRHPRGKQE